MPGSAQTTSTTPSEALLQRADQFTRLLTDIAADEQHIVRTGIHMDEMRPLRDDDFPDGMYRLTDATPAGFYCYEDAGMTTGGFLAAQSIRHQVTGEAEALAAADRAFEGLRFIYDLGKQKQEGFFPKPYGLRISDEISRDQYIFVLAGLAAYHRITGPERRAEIEHMAQKMAEYWISINYSYSYFSIPPTSHLKDYMGPLILGLIGIAGAICGREHIERERDRLFEQENLGPRMRETLREQFRQGRTYDGGMYFRQSENAMMMKSMAIDHLWNADPEHRDLWQRALRKFWDDDVLIQLDRESGMNYWFLGYDRDKDQTFLTEPGVIPELENPLNLPFLTWGGRRKHAGSVQVAYAATVIAHRLGSAEAGEVALDILAKMDQSKFRALTVPDAKHLPPGCEWEQSLLHTCYLAYWLWSYWLGRQRQLW